MRERAAKAFRDGDPRRARAVVADFSHRWANKLAASVSGLVGALVGAMRSH